MPADLINVTVSGVPSTTGLVFVPPNPFDAIAWTWQVARFAPTMRVVTIELPGYGRGTSGAVPSLAELVDVIWTGISDRADCDDYVLVGCSVGGAIAERMYWSRPLLVSGLVLVGVGWQKPRGFITERIDHYRRLGADYRREYALDVLSPMCARSPYGQGVADLLLHRNPDADVDSIISLLEALREPDPQWLRDGIAVPSMVVCGSQDPGLPYSKTLAAEILRCPLTVIPGGGHACHADQPWQFNQVLAEFLPEPSLRQQFGYGDKEQLL